MKLFVIILSFYFTALSALPCADGDNITATAKKEITNQEKHADDHQDLCSPFCVCACCGTYMLNYAPTLPFVAKPKSQVVTQAASLYKSTLVSSYQHSIWQPPQLS
ncbi:hypothetical protein FLLO111716_01120 [Flavobacterium longum]|uniref:DUF6660 family protein n=1 Tax=Flavobacterium longum TaxID=1299340 RepID=UPI0039E920AA